VHDRRDQVAAVVAHRPSSEAAERLLALAFVRRSSWISRRDSRISSRSAAVTAVIAVCFD
jgi:hypothetical protein